ncbi:MAG: hypothetical protein ABSH49_27210 [Bryobacteraceae bacterium]|jgi:hypothetical protein
MLIIFVVLFVELEFLAAPLAFGGIWEMAQAAIASGVLIGCWRTRHPETLQIVNWSQLTLRVSCELARAA